MYRSVTIFMNNREETYSSGIQKEFGGLSYIQEIHEKYDNANSSYFIEVKRNSETYLIFKGLPYKLSF